MSFMNIEKAIELKEGFSTADAEYPSISLKDGNLSVQFIDWQENPVNLSFKNTCAVKWQETFTLGPETRDDMSYEIENSAWIAEHRAQGARAPEEPLRHFKLCFNACGVLEVIASQIEVTT